LLIAASLYLPDCFFGRLKSQQQEHEVALRRLQR